MSIYHISHYLYWIKLVWELKYPPWDDWNFKVFHPFCPSQTCHSRGWLNPAHVQALMSCFWAPDSSFRSCCWLQTPTTALPFFFLQTPPFNIECAYDSGEWAHLESFVFQFCRKPFCFLSRLICTILIWIFYMELLKVKTLNVNDSNLTLWDIKPSKVNSSPQKC